MEYAMMRNQNSKDIPTFYTEIAEVSITGGILVIRILDERPDEEAINRHCRILSAKLKGSKFPVIVDMRYLDSSDILWLDKMLQFEGVGKRKIVILTKPSVCAGSYTPYEVFESEQDAITRLRKADL